jgi:hypothetical protein
MIRFQIALREPDFKALQRLSETEYRDHRQQAGLLIREALERRGLIDARKAKASNPKVRGQNGS